jgi:hypothetical protein
MLLLSCPALSAQDSPWQVILNSSDTLTASRLDSLHENILSATCDDRALSIPVDSIAALVQYTKGHFWNGAGIGTLVGAGAGAVIGLVTYQKPEPKGFITIDLGSGPAALGGALIGAVGGFAVGGIIGALSSGHEMYDLKGKKLRVKLYIIGQLIAK